MDENVLHKQLLKGEGDGTGRGEAAPFLLPSHAPSNPNLPLPPTSHTLQPIAVLPTTRPQLCPPLPGVCVLLGNNFPRFRLTSLRLVSVASAAEGRQSLPSLRIILGAGREEERLGGYTGGTWLSCVPPEGAATLTRSHAQGGGNEGGGREEGARKVQKHERKRDEV